MVTRHVAPLTNRPYCPPSNVLAIVNRLRDRNLPDQVDSEYLRDAGIPEGTNNRTLFGLRFLGLIGEGYEITEALRAIHTATDEEYRNILAGLVREAYAEVFASIDPAQDPQDRIINFFRRYTPASQRDRMVIFFLGMCREAGIAALDVPRQRASGATIGRATQQRPARQHPLERQNRRDGGRDSEQRLTPALDMLLRSLPPVGSAFPPERREPWLNMVRATLDYLYPQAAPQQEAAVQVGNAETP